MGAAHRKQRAAQCQTKASGVRCPRPKGHVGECDTSEPTITELLAMAGYRHEPIENGSIFQAQRRRIIRIADGVAVASLKVGEVCDWLRSLPSEGPDK